jgi:hypothetical protein
MFKAVLLAAKVMLFRHLLVLNKYVGKCWSNQRLNRAVLLQTI